MRTTRVTAPLATFLVLSAVACGSSGGGSGFDGDAGKKPSADAGTGIVTPGTDGGSEQPPDLGNPVGPSNPLELDGGGCATASAEVRGAPVYMQIIFDGSGSMDDPVTPNGPRGVKWKAATGALLAFFNDLALKADQSFGVGLFLFDGTQEVNDFKREDVPIRFVDATQLNRLTQRIRRSSPSGGTPIGMSLDGQIPILANYQPVAPLKDDGKRILVLITDGVPGGGAIEQARCVQRVTDARTQTPPVTTFTIGVGDPTSDPSLYDPVFLGKMSEAGGTSKAGCLQGWNGSSPAGSVPCHFQVTPGAQTADQVRDALVAAFDGIRGAATACEFVLEKPEGGGALDPNKVNVKYTAGDGTETTILQSETDGWSYDDPSNPTRILFHGDTCEKTKRDAGAKVSIVVGCKTQVSR
ncbi:MAG: vWA domain-containing protein [Polyangiaceae bacterium]